VARRREKSQRRLTNVFDSVKGRGSNGAFMSPWDVDEVFTSSTLNYHLSFAATNHWSRITALLSALSSFNLLPLSAIFRALLQSPEELTLISVLSSQQRGPKFPFVVVLS
jgi:hypothetical protein